MPPVLSFEFFFFLSCSRVVLLPELHCGWNGWRLVDTWMQLYQIRPSLWKTLGNLPGNHHISPMGFRKDCKTMEDRTQMQNQAQTVCETIKSHGKATLTHGDKGGSKKPDIKGFPSKNASHLIKFVGNCPRLACVHKMFTNFSHAVGHLKRISVACTTDVHHHSLGIASCINSS